MCLCVLLHVCIHTCKNKSDIFMSCRYWFNQVLQDLALVLFYEWKCQPCIVLPDHNFRSLSISCQLLWLAAVVYIVINSTFLFYKLGNNCEALEFVNI